MNCQIILHKHTHTDTIQYGNLSDYTLSAWELEKIVKIDNFQFTILEVSNTKIDMLQLKLLAED